MTSSDAAHTIAEYLAGPDRLQAALNGLADADLDLAADAESWTIRMIVHHVADGDDIWKTSIKQTIGVPGGEFSLQWYWEVEQDEWAERWNYRERPIDSSLAMFRANREHIVQLLKQIPEALENTMHISWPEGQEQDLSIAWVLEMQARHVEQHVQDIQRIRAAHAAQTVHRTR